MKTNKHEGSSLDDLLIEDDIFAEVKASALKRVIAFQVGQEMKRRKLTASALARRMKSSVGDVRLLLDPTNPVVTLQTLERAALALGKSLKVEFA
jgi:hypothetical protein